MKAQFTMDSSLDRVIFFSYLLQRMLFYSKEYTWFETIVSFVEDRSGKIPYKNISYIF